MYEEQPINVLTSISFPGGKVGALSRSPSTTDSGLVYIIFKKRPADPARILEGRQSLARLDFRAVAEGTGPDEGGTWRQTDGRRLQRRALSPTEATALGGEYMYTASFDRFAPLYGEIYKHTVVAQFALVYPATESRVVVQFIGTSGLADVPCVIHGVTSGATADFRGFPAQDVFGGTNLTGWRYCPPAPPSGTDILFSAAYSAAYAIAIGAAAPVTAFIQDEGFVRLTPATTPWPGWVSGEKVRIVPV
jgi:hypothetical protein